MTGKPILDKVLMVVNLLGVLFAVGIFVYTEVVFKRPLPEDSVAYKEFLKELNDQKLLNTFKVEKLTINLVSASQRLRFLDIEAQLEPLKAKHLDALAEDNAKAMVKDSMINIISRMKPQELNTLSGKILLEDRIKKRLNYRFGRPIVKRVYFTKYVVQ